jgi:hypothetical protein
MPYITTLLGRIFADRLTMKHKYHFHKRKEGKFDIEKYLKMEYGKPDETLRERLFYRLGSDFRAYIEQYIEYGICRIPRVLCLEEIRAIQVDIARWEKTKTWDADNHIGFDGNSGERYLETSESLSRAITHPVILNAVTAALGEHPRLSFVRTTLLNPIEPYERRAFQWHHDGHSATGIRVMILLSDLPDTGQAMVYCPATNKRVWVTKSSRETRFTREYVHPFLKYICSGQAGDVIIFNNHGIHRGQRNNSVRRDTILLNFQPGLARNYPLPGLESTVVGELTEYEREVFGLFDAPTFRNIKDFPRANRRWRKKARRFYESYSIPSGSIQPYFTAEGIDRRIDAAGRYNYYIYPKTEQFVDSKENAARLLFKSKLQKEFRHLDYLLAKKTSLHNVPLLSTLSLRDKVWNDMHADLDLPLRLYHPNLDQIRDNAITQTRDGKGPQLVQEMLTHARQLSYMKLANTSSAKYEQYAKRLRDLTNSVPIALLERRNMSEISSALHFLSDLSEMLKNAYTRELTRSTLLYVYLISLVILTSGVQSHQRQEFIKISDATLIAYIKLLLIGEMSLKGK